MYGIKANLACTLGNVSSGFKDSPSSKGKDGSVSMIPQLSRARAVLKTVFTGLLDRLTSKTSACNEKKSREYLNLEWCHLQEVL